MEDVSQISTEDRLHQGVHGSLAKPNLICWILVAAISLGPLWLIFEFGVRVPFQDDFEFLRIAEFYRTGHWDPAWFWSAAGEHRILIPRLLAALIIPVTQWDSRWMMFISWVFCVASFAFIISRLRAQAAQKENWMNWLSFVTIAILLFSPCQFEVWLWAIGMAVFLVNLGIIGCIFFASKCSTRGWMMPALAVLFAAIASCSFGQGLNSWPLLICTFLFIRVSWTRRIALIVFSLAVFVVIAACYFTNFNPPNVGKFGLEGFIDRPITALTVFLCQLGTPLAFGFHGAAFHVTSALGIGAVLLILFVAASALCLRAGLRQECAFWIGLGLSAVMFAALTTYGRGSFGPEAMVITSRYTTECTLLSVAVVGLLVLSSSCLGRGKLLLTSFTVLATISIAALSLSSWKLSLEVAARTKVERNQALAVLPFLLYMDPSLDGLPGTPLFALCPAPGHKFYHVLKTYLDYGFERQISGAAFEIDAKNSAVRVSLTFRRTANGTLVKGDLHKPIPADFASVVFIGRPRMGGLIGAAAITPGSSSHNSTLEIVIPDNALGSNEELSFWMFRPEMNAFTKLDIQNGSNGLPLLGRGNRADAEDLLARASGPADGYVDLVNGRPVTPVIESAGSTVHVMGWGAVDAKAGLLSEKIVIRLLDNQDHCLRGFVALGMERPDVEAVFNQKPLRWAGFEGAIDVENCPEVAYIEVLAKSNGRYLRVGNRIQLSRP